MNIEVNLFLGVDVIQRRDEVEKMFREVAVLIARNLGYALLSFSQRFFSLLTISEKEKSDGE